MIIYQPKITSFFEPDVELDKDIIVIGNPETQHNVDKLRDFLDSFKKVTIFALDTETYSDVGAGALYFKYNRLRLVQIGLEDGRVLIIDFGGWKEESLWIEIQNRPEVVETLEILADKSFDNNVAILGVYLAFDFNNIRQHLNIIARQARDLMILSQIIWSGVGAYKHGMTALCAISHGLKGIAARLGFEVDKSQQTSEWGWTMTNRQINYAAVDVRILFPIFAEMRRLINLEGLQYTARAESRAVAVFANMQFLGMPVRIEEARRLLAEQKSVMADNLAIFLEHYPGVQYTSQPQLLDALKSKLVQYDIKDTSKETLVTLDCPGVKALLKLKKAEAQVKSIQTIIDYEFNGCIHALYNQISPTATGRSTSRADVSAKTNGKKYKITIGLQAQNINKKIKDIFGYEEDDDMILGVFDGSAMHQRIATQFSEDPALISGYVEDKDLHSLLASQIAQILGYPAKKWTYDYVRTTREDEESEDFKLANLLRDLAKKAFYSCVPLDVKALSRKGWVGYDELKVGDEILAYDIETNTNRWTPVLEKFYYEDAPVYEWRVGKSKVFRSTENHRWFGKKRVRRPSNCETSFTYYENHWFETGTKTTESIIINSAKAESGRGADLTNYIHKNTQDSFWSDLVLNMTESERWLWFSANIATDGYMGKYEVCRFTQDITKQPGLFYAMQLCGYLLGFNPVVWKGGESNKCWTISFQKRNSTTLQQCKETLLPNQPVWCVRTEFGTWVTKCDDYVSITGNSLNGSGAGKILMGLHQMGFGSANFDDAFKIYKAFYTLYSRLVAFIKENHKKACSTKYRFDFPDAKFRSMRMHERDYGKIKSLTGRIQYLEFEPGKHGEQVSYTKATGNLWQLAEGDMLKMWMADVQDKFWETPEWGANIINMVHDEIVVSCKKEYKDVVARFIVDKMNEIWSKWVTIIPVVPQKVIDNPSRGMVLLWSQGK